MGAYDPTRTRRVDPTPGALTFFQVEETLPGYQEPKRLLKREFVLNHWWGRREKMRAIKVGILSAAVLVAAAGIGFGIAQAGGADWNVEALDSFYVDQPETSMAMESPLETGSLPSESDTSFASIEVGGAHYRGEVDAGP